MLAVSYQHVATDLLYLTGLIILNPIKTHLVQSAAYIILFISILNKNHNS